jgi:hypothetical protein
MGLVLVFDLDETLIGTTKPYKDGKYYIEDIQLNDKLFQIIFHAKGLKEGGLVDAILLLTNNTNMPSVYREKEGNFLAIIDSVVKDKYHMNFNDIFDNIYTGTRDNMKKRARNFVPVKPSNKNKYPSSSYRLTSSVPYDPYGFVNQSAPTSSTMLNYRPSKDIETVAKMLSEIEISTENLENRIIFFDDEPRAHVLKKELEGHDGIYVTIDPPFGKDKTDLKGVYAALGMFQAKGGARRRRTARKKKQLRRTKKYRVKKASS